MRPDGLQLDCLSPPPHPDQGQDHSARLYVQDQVLAARWVSTAAHLNVSIFPTALLVPLQKAQSCSLPVLPQSSAFRAQHAGQFCWLGSAGVGA